jgi:ribosomal protein S18 acetylase RimI-like enzyme
MHTIAIRAARMEDIAPILILEDAVFPGDRLSRRSLRAFVVAGRNPFLVAVEGERLAGYALIALRAGGRVARLYSIAVEPAFARRGVGRLLLCASEAAAARAGRDIMRLEVREDNHGAIALYERNGYRRLRRAPNYYNDGSAALRYGKDLAALGTSKG